MNKYLVLIIVVLLAVVLFIRYHEREEAVPEAPPSSAQEGEEGVPLPPDARALPEFSPAAYQPVSRLGGTAQQPAQQPAPEISPLSMSPDPCLRDTKVKDVFAGYEEWSLRQKDRAKSPAEKAMSYAITESVGEEGIKSLVARIVNYQACLSLARDKDLCGELSKVDGDKAPGETALNMRQSCAEVLAPLGFAGYSLGKSAYSFCSARFKSQMRYSCMEILDPANSAGFSKSAYSLCSAHFKNERQDAGRYESEFCDKAKGGPQAINAKFCPGLPPELKRMCQEDFPGDISGCDQESCRQMWRAYEAVRKNSPGDLPYDFLPLVSALIDKKEERCRPLADAIVQGYCSMKSRIDQQMMRIEMTSKQAEMDKVLRSAREKQSTD